MFSNKWKFEKRFYEQSAGDEGGGNKAPAPTPVPTPAEKVIFTPEQQEHIHFSIPPNFLSHLARGAWIEIEILEENGRFIILFIKAFIIFCSVA